MLKCLNGLIKQQRFLLTIGRKNKTKDFKKVKVVPGFELGLPGSKPRVITTTLYNQLLTVKCNTFLDRFY